MHSNTLIMKFKVDLFVIGFSQNLVLNFKSKKFHFLIYFNKNIFKNFYDINFFLQVFILGEE